MFSRAGSSAFRCCRALPPAVFRVSQPVQYRALSSAAADAAAAAAASPRHPARPTFFRRALSFTGGALLFTSLGLIMVLGPAYESAAAILSSPSDAESLSLFTPPDEDAQAKEDFINSHPLTLSLRSDPDFIESRPHMKIPPSWRKHNLTGGTLMGPGKVAVPPFSWSEKSGKNFVQITHVGTDLCGHMGIIHGGFLATMLDEGLARCCFPVLPFNIGMTAKLEINYKAPAMANQYLVLRATTIKVEGRKAWVEGHIETLPTEEGQEPVVLATASALYISPKQASVSIRR
ncbi:HotDog domain-containing protein [Echria macrotheca]|uniref:HotDog domain-containing protein n=1 Tax=Echria macrotheca TaxID=438768 RepID=A0AAJ0BKH4_9PEZI|nr:HotDog domain-containing protein [Echria macrotheca]